MPRMVHPDAPEPFDTLTDDQADVLRDLGWKDEAPSAAAPKRQRPARKTTAKKTAKKSAAPPAATTTAGGPKPTGTEKE